MTKVRMIYLTFKYTSSPQIRFATLQYFTPQQPNTQNKKLKNLFDILNNRHIFAVLKNKEKNNEAIQWQIINHH